jgi:hypothetical protein
MSGEIKKQKLGKTERGLTMIMEDMKRSLHKLRTNDGDLVALQALTFIFSGNPVIIFSYEPLMMTCTSIAESVRSKAVAKFAAFGGKGPEVIPRMLGDDKVWCQAADQALGRFNDFIAEAARVQEEAQREEAAQAAGAQAVVVPSSRMQELIALSENRELTPDEQVELDEFRKGLRASIAAVSIPETEPVAPR